MAQNPESGSPPAFPKLLALPAVERPVRLPVTHFAEVRSADDLPDRLLLGDLRPESFRWEKKGCSAEWVDANGYRARFRYAGGLSSLKLAYRGDEAVTLTSAKRFIDLGQTVQTIHPGAWLDILGRDLEGQYNLRVFPHRKDNTAGGNFPDGHALGTPAAAMPVRETDEERVAAWTLRRSHYLHVAHLHLREADRLVSRLAGAGFIAKAGEAREGHLHAPKFGVPCCPSATNTPRRMPTGSTVTGAGAWSTRSSPTLMTATPWVASAVKCGSAP